jgi:uncharacterized protein YecE (DUF72 family)
LPPGRWLEFYAAGFATVESNAAFYRLPESEVFAAWAERTPPDFVMSVKVSRYLTTSSGCGIRASRSDAS